jgi:chemotaxis response regulator CheB
MLWTFLSADEDRVRSKGRNIIVVGTAAGGLEALTEVSLSIVS